MEKNCFRCNHWSSSYINCPVFSWYDAYKTNRASLPNSPPPKVPTSTAVVISDTSVLFDEDFEDGKAQKVTFVADGWQIIADETGNFVYDIDNSGGSDFPGINFGSSSWKDYEVNLRIRFLSAKDAWGIIYFRNNGVDSSAYIVSIIPTHTGLSYNPKGSGWIGITNHEYNFSRNTWHWVRIEAKGAEIKVFIDNELIINTDDTRYTYGFVNIQAGQYTHMQIDDIQVTSLDE